MSLVERRGDERAIDFIKSRIFSGEFPAGSALNEQSLSEQIGRSRTPIREALKVLENQGFVRIEPHRGATVTELDARDVRELYELRTCLERYAIKEALARDPRPDLQPLQLALRGQERALEDDDPSRFFAFDHDFHLGVLRLLGNRRIEAIMEHAWDQVIRCAFQAARRQPRQAEAHEEHRRLLRALEAGGAEAAIAASGAHLYNSVRRVLLG